jgi:hypothetical protein
MTAKQDFLDNIYKLASQVAEEAQQEDTKFDQRVEALKALNPYYAAIVKAKGKDDESDAPGENFGKWRDRLSLVETEPDGGSEGVQAGGGSRRG